MISLEPDAALSPAERYGLDTLIDLSRLLVVDPNAPLGDVQIVRLSIGDRPLSNLAHGDWQYEVTDGNVTVSRGMLASIADLAGAGIEQRSQNRDRHGRVPSADNPMVAADHSRDPVVSRCATALRGAVGRAAGRRPVWSVAAWPEGRRWSVALTHDLDLVAGWPFATGLRLVELLRHGHVGRAGAVVAAATTGAFASLLDDAPVWYGVRRLLEIEAEHSIRSTWFIITGTPSWATFRSGDITYRPESRAARRILAAVWSGGHEIGLHGSFVTSDDPAAFPAQRSRLRSIADIEIAGVRQHYLRMRPGRTQRDMLSAGFTYDSTYGFPDRNGFRLGVADVVQGWDDDRQRVTGLDEVPIVWMDRAQSKYQHIEDPNRWIDDALDLARTCEAAEGLWVGLWHPNLTPPLGFPGAFGAYERLVRELVAGAPYVAPLDRIVAWRRARRAVRAIGIESDGRVVLRGAQSPAGTVPIMRLSL